MLKVEIKKQLKAFKLDVAFESENETVGILGKSGSGKSLTLKCIAGLVQPDEGKIILDNRVLFDSETGINLPIRERKIGYLFQNYALFPHMTVKENINFGIHHLPKSVREEKISVFLEKVDMKGMEKRYPSQLSGGQQQRIAMARALVMEPDVLLLDEPFSALDWHLRYEMETELKTILKGYDKSAIFVSHDINESYRLSNQMLIYHEGRIVANGPSKEIFDHPNHVEVAAITGCKNISTAQRLDNNTIFVPQWGVELRVPSTKEQISHVGIRAHFIEPSGNKDIEDINRIQCYVRQVIESPFEVNVSLEIANESRGRIKWVMPKEKWLPISRTLDNHRIYVTFPMNRLIIM